MKDLDDLLLLGDPPLYQVCEPVQEDELPLVKNWVADLHNVMQQIRERYHFGRAIAAPQLGIMKRLIYMNIDKPVVFPHNEHRSFLVQDVFSNITYFIHLIVAVQFKPVFINKRGDGLVHPGVFGRITL